MILVHIMKVLQWKTTSFIRLLELSNNAFAENMPDNNIFMSLLSHDIFFTNINPPDTSLFTGHVVIYYSHSSRSAINSTTKESIEFCDAHNLTL